MVTRLTFCRRMVQNSYAQFQVAGWHLPRKIAMKTTSEPRVLCATNSLRGNPMSNDICGKFTKLTTSSLVTAVVRNSLSQLAWLFTIRWNTWRPKRVPLRVCRHQLCPNGSLRCAQDSWRLASRSCFSHFVQRNFHAKMSAWQETSKQRELSVI